ncbi:MAG: TlpA family protein disulfide reductase, partial [Giesbergeria sp.]|nr:TlpA family protein disulfide reductase [Giesbergeria sp.]
MRRRASLWSLGMAAACGGLGWAWLQSPSGGDSGAPSEAEQTLWQQRFQSPDGAEWAMQSLRGQPLVVNFWATWCPPCIAELPLLDDFYQQNAANSWQVVGLA